MSGWLSLLLVFGGLGAIAVAMPQHWRQWRGEAPRPAGVMLGLRVAGALALLVALILCLNSSHPTIGALVWVMQTALGAVLVAFLFASRSPASRT